MKTFLIEHLVHELPTIVKRCFVSFNKVAVLFKISVLENYILFVSKITNQVRLLRTIT